MPSLLEKGKDIGEFFYIGFLFVLGVRLSLKVLVQKLEEFSQIFAPPA